MYYYVIAGAEKCSGTYYSVRSVVGAHTIKQEMQKILPSGNMTLRSFYLENWENKNNYCYAWRMVENSSGILRCFKMALAMRNTLNQSCRQKSKRKERQEIGGRGEKRLCAFAFQRHFVTKVKSIWRFVSRVLCKRHLCLKGRRGNSHSVEVQRTLKWKVNCKLLIPRKLLKGGAKTKKNLLTRIQFFVKLIR